MKTAWTNQLSSILSERRMVITAPLKPFPVPVSFLEHTPHSSASHPSCFSPAERKQSDALPATPLTHPISGHVWLLVLLPSWRLCMCLSLSLGCPLPTPLLGQFLELSVSTLEEPSPASSGCDTCSDYSWSPSCWHWSDWFVSVIPPGCLVVNECLLRESDSSKSKGRTVLGEIHGGLYWLLSVVNDYLSGQLKLHLGQALEIIRGCQGLNVVGCDLVEVSPPYDPSGE